MLNVISTFKFRLPSALMQNYHRLLDVPYYSLQFACEILCEQHLLLQRAILKRSGVKVVLPGTMIPDVSYSKTLRGPNEMKRNALRLWMPNTYFH